MLTNPQSRREPAAGLAPPNAALARATTFVIYSDYSGVCATEDGYGTFATELEALASLIDRLEAERATTAAKLSRAKARRRHLVSKATGK